MIPSSLYSLIQKVNLFLKNLPKTVLKIYKYRSFGSLNDSTLLWFSTDKPWCVNPTSIAPSASDPSHSPVEIFSTLPLWLPTEDYLYLPPLLGFCQSQSPNLLSIPHFSLHSLSLSLWAIGSDYSNSHLHFLSLSLSLCFSIVIKITFFQLIDHLSNYLFVFETVVFWDCDYSLWLWYCDHC